MSCTSVFVYGTLKPGERNFGVAEKGGLFEPTTSINIFTYENA